MTAHWCALGLGGRGRTRSRKAWSGARCTIERATQHGRGIGGIVRTRQPAGEKLSALRPGLAAAADEDRRESAPGRGAGTGFAGIAAPGYGTGSRQRIHRRNMAEEGAGLSCRKRWPQGMHGAGRRARYPQRLPLVLRAIGRRGFGFTAVFELVVGVLTIARAYDRLSRWVQACLPSPSSFDDSGLDDPAPDDPAARVRVRN